MKELRYTVHKSVENKTQFNQEWDHLIQKIREVGRPLGSGATEVTVSIGGKFLPYPLIESAVEKAQNGDVITVRVDGGMEVVFIKVIEEFLKKNL